MLSMLFGGVIMSVWERLDIRGLPEMRKHHVIFPAVIYNRNVMNEYSFIIETERIINSILNKGIIIRRKERCLMKIM